MGPVVKLLQMSDVHFGARVTGSRLGLPLATAALRAEERRNQFARAIDLVEQRNLDGVLIPGDLFDDESVTTDLLRFVLHQLGRVAPKPVFIAPGNHDPYGGPSPYNPLTREAARGLTWPDNVVVFAHEDFRTVHWPGRPEISVTGCGVQANLPSATRRLAARIDPVESALSLFLFHGSRDDGTWLQSDKATYPFSKEELLAQGFHWTALGHYHDAQILNDSSGVPRAAYSGCLQASGLDEMGAKGCLVVEVSAANVKVDRIPLDRRQIRRVECDLTGSFFAEDARSRVVAALQAAGCDEQDLLLLELVGRRSPGLDLSFLGRMANDFFHMKVDVSQLHPDIDLDDYPELDEAVTVEQRFVARLKTSLEGEDAPTARRALLYGLDALHRGRIDNRYEA